MSRICGVTDHKGRAERVSALIGSLVKPMLHSPLYETETASCEGCAFTHIFHNPNYSASYLDQKGPTDPICLFNGYLINLDTISRRVHQETNGRVAIANPAELISYLILEKGPDSLSELNGIFSFAVWQPADRSLWLGVDRFGMRPLYYSQQASFVKFASEVKALLAAESDIEPDYCALEEMFVFGFLLENRTMFQNISRVPPATVLKFHHNKIREYRYWWYDQIQIDSQLTVDDYSVENDRLFRKSIENLSHDSNSVTCLLSSGYDSRRIILELVNFGKKVHSFTTAYSKGEDRYEVESGISRRLGSELGSQHTVVEQAAPAHEPHNIFRMLMLLDFESDEHQFIMPLLSQLPVNGYMNFDGIGGDILINGLFLRKDILAVVHDNKKVAEKILSHNPNLWSSYVRLDSSQPTLEERILRILGDLPDSPNKLTQFFFLTRTRREIGLFPYGLLNLKTESYLPYLDNMLVDQSLSLKPELKCGTNLQEKILRIKYSNLMDTIPNSHIKNISKNLDDSNRDFCKPLGDYWIRVQRKVCSASSKEMLKSGRFLFVLTARAVLLSVGFLVMNLFGRAPRFAIRKAWSLKKLGQLAFLHNVINDRDNLGRQLDKARDFVFGTKDNDQLG